MTDRELVDGCTNKNAGTQKKLFDKYSRLMMAICLRYANTQEEAEDIFQEGFITVFQKMGTFKGTGSLQGWLKKVFVNTAIQHYRSNSKIRNARFVNGESVQIATSGNILESLGLQDIMKAIQALPTGYRTVFNLFAIEGYSHKEIAAQLGISEGTSKSQYYDAKRHLRQMIRESEVVR